MCSCKSHLSNKQPAAVKQVVKSVPLGSGKPKTETPVSTPATHVNSSRNASRRRVVVRRPI